MAQRSRFVGLVVVSACLCGAAQAPAQTLFDSSSSQSTSVRLKPDTTDGGNFLQTTISDFTLRAQILATGLTGATKVVARRTRPDGTSLSFLSGHTATAFATATVLQRDLGWKVGVPAYVAATYVGASRIEDRKHFLSDVAFGATLGIVAGHTVTLGRGEARFAVAPMATTAGAGVNFSWAGKN